MLVRRSQFAASAGDSMALHVLRVIILLWLAWYISGPVAEMFDFWDTPREEIHDVARSAGGLVALIGVTFAILISQIRRIRELFRQRSRSLRRRILVAMQCVRDVARWILVLPSHSPPVPLRI